MPSITIAEEETSILDILVKSGIAASKGQAKTLIAQGGIALNNEKIDDITYHLTDEDFKEGYAILKKGKKTFVKVIK